MLQEQLIIWDPVSHDFVSFFAGKSSALYENNDLAGIDRQGTNQPRANLTHFTVTDSVKTSRSSTLTQNNGPFIPARVSSMSARKRASKRKSHSDLTTIQQQSRQFFASLNGKISPPPKYEQVDPSTTSPQKTTNRPSSSGAILSSPSMQISTSEDHTNDIPPSMVPDRRRKHRSAIYPSMDIRTQTGELGSQHFEEIIKGGFNLENRDRLIKQRSHSKLLSNKTTSSPAKGTAAQSRTVENAREDSTNSGLKGLAKKFVSGRWRKNESRGTPSGEKNVKTPKTTIASTSPVKNRVAVESWLEATAAVESSTSNSRQDDIESSSARRFRMSGDPDNGDEEPQVFPTKHIVRVSELDRLALAAALRGQGDDSASSTLVETPAAPPRVQATDTSTMAKKIRRMSVRLSAFFG